MILMDESYELFLNFNSLYSSCISIKRKIFIYKLFAVVQKILLICIPFFRDCHFEFDFIISQSFRERPP